MVSFLFVFTSPREFTPAGVVERVEAALTSVAPVLELFPDVPGLTVVPLPELLPPTTSDEPRPKPPLLSSVRLLFLISPTPVRLLLRLSETFVLPLSEARLASYLSPNDLDSPLRPNPPDPPTDPL
jgi:hypothetical protein